MKAIVKKTGLFIFYFLFLQYLATAQQKAAVREYKKVFTTYPFSDPDPTPKVGKFILAIASMVMQTSLFRKNGKW